VSLISLSQSPATISTAASEVLLLIWEGQPPHGCQAHWGRTDAAPPHGADQEIQIRLWDLLPVVRKHVYHPAFAGSYSLKSVLPALVPDMTYEGMPVANGQEAGLDWELLVRGGLDQPERERTRKALLDYCGQDTLALVRMLDKVQSVPQP
jgi:hypothetical protein